ncbi:MAG: hypothetical protein BAA01_10320 [Bacillus thermozeamaize]|uniref:SLH domain-containing protein n=1 Tax=Bacillus thermozeamaize TaxID=230954 RepID=A0A1Y3PNR0_9BACI|nr:MAG: hypothetical protein BAA01_10320 [Bacillus thermozeamaize]
MKRLAIRKTAGLMALIMTISLMLPIIAYAAAEFVKVEVNADGKVSVVFKVTDDVYAAENFFGREVVVNVYDKNGKLGTITLTYQKGYGNDGYYYVGTSDSIAKLVNQQESVYLNVYGFVNDNVPIAVYEIKPSDSKPTPIYFPPIPIGDSDVDVVKANPDGTVDAGALKAALAKGYATVEISGDVAKLPASALTEGGIVKIVSPLGWYELPLSELDLEALAEQLGVELDDLWIVVTIAEVQGGLKASAEQTLGALGEIVSPIVEFKLEAVAGDNSVEISKFSQFIKRALKLNAEGGSLVGVRVNGNAANPLPTKAGDGEAIIYSNTNSVYGVVAVAPKSFTDLANHWSRDYVTKLANKLIVEGTGAGKFDPNRDVTRAEFAAMIVRALGLEASGNAPFSDVADSAWYAKAVAAAAEYGIVNGYSDGTFRPNNKITRQELAAMVVRAQKLAGKEVVLSNAEIASLLSGYKDAGKIGAWARAELAAAIKAQIVQGRSSSTVAPTATATRAEAATMINRFLTNVDFI